MRIKGLAYALRDAREEWGDFRIPTIEALIHIGKVTRSCEVRREGTSNWQPIMHVPELAQLFDGAGGELPGGKGTAGRKTGEGPAIGAGARRAIRPPQDQLAPTAAALAASAAEASEPYLEAVEQESYPSTEATTYKVICADGTMLGPLPLPMLLAQIWDRRVGSADLVSRDAGSWVSAVQLPELARALEKVEPGGEAQGRTVTPSPSGSPLPNSSRSLSALPISGAGLAAPEPAGASFVTEVVRSPLRPLPGSADEDGPTNLIDGKQLARQLSEAFEVKTRAVQLPEGEQALLEGRLEQVPLIKILGRILRTKLTGRLILEGPYRLVLHCTAGSVVGGQHEPQSLVTEQMAARMLKIPEQAIEQALQQGGSLVSNLLQAQTIDERSGRSLRSLISLEEALAPFGWRSGSYAFVESHEIGPPTFHLHPYDFLRAGLSVGFSHDEMEAAVAGWTHASIAPGTGPAAVDAESMPLTPEEKQILWLVQTGCSFGDAVSHSVERLGLPRPLVLRSLYAMYQLGMLTLVSGRTSSSASAVARGLYDPTLPMDLLVRNVQETDFFTLLGLTRQDEPGDVQSAFLRARAQVRSLTGDPKQLERILARLERALRCLADPAQRRIYLEQGEQALPGEQTVVRTTTPLPMDAAGVRFAAASTTTTSGHQLPAVQIPPRTEAPSRENISGGRTATPVPRTTSSLELLQAQNFEKARRHVESKQYGEALLLLRQLVKVAPVVGRYQAYLAWASYLDGKQTVEDTMATKNAMDQAIHLDLDDPDAYYFRGMLHARMEATRKAKQDLTLALDLNKEHTAAREALTRLGEAARKKTQQGDRRQLTIALGLFGLAFAVLFYAANFLGHDPAAVVDSWGAEEAYYHPTNWFFYARRGSLLLLGVLGSLLLFRREKSEGVGGKTFLGLCYGLVLGYLSYAMYSLSFPKDEVPGISLVMLMVVLHACADEFFFRGVVARAILPFFGQLLPGALIASLIYGLYHLSYVSYWWSLHYFYPAQLLGSMPVQVVSLSVTMGLPLTLLYAKSRSVVPGIFAQVAFGWVFLILTIYHAQG